MKPPTPKSYGVPLILLLFSIYSNSGAPYNIPRLTLHGSIPQYLESISPSSSPVSLHDFETYFYEQTLDHFNYGPPSYATFKQKYAINTKYWGGANSSSPIFAHLGAESPLDHDFLRVGFPVDHAPFFNALVVYVEHRYYGESVPFGSMEEALKNETTRGFFNSAQAIADYAEVLLYVKERFSSPNSPVIVFGGSYGGMLAAAAWFRLKYPHIAIGALASSAPVLYFDNITPQDGYYWIVTKDFLATSASCYRTIKDSWDIVDNIASQPGGLSILSQRFKTCSHLNSGVELKNFLVSMYASHAQYNHPPDYPLTVLCEAIDRAGSQTDIIGQIFAGVESAFGKNSSCYDVNYFHRPTETNEGWGWQRCSEMVMPIGRTVEAHMFQPAPFNLTEFTQYCKLVYGVPPRPHWITTYYGGHDIKLTLQKFASNIIFSNGRKDPYSSGGVLEDLSDSLLAISTAHETGPDLQSVGQRLSWKQEKRLDTFRGAFDKWVSWLRLISSKPKYGSRVVSHATEDGGSNHRRMDQNVLC
ncbi:uncharacterized protein [Coffea arabica]|uniref:Uncharacterized protein isoform X3 n=1 Tax=Coffea arabica TaxID=13443 RepID=A0ABM4V3Z5_COFAR